MQRLDIRLQYWMLTFARGAPLQSPLEQELFI
jgi:hypothetical protein